MSVFWEGIPKQLIYVRFGGKADIRMGLLVCNGKVDLISILVFLRRTFG